MAAKKKAVGKKKKRKSSYEEFGTVLFTQDFFEERIADPGSYIITYGVQCNRELVLSFEVWEGNVLVDSTQDTILPSSFQFQDVLIQTFDFNSDIRIKVNSLVGINDASVDLQLSLEIFDENGELIAGDPYPVDDIPVGGVFKKKVAKKKAARKKKALRRR